MRTLNDIIFAAQLTSWALATPTSDRTALHFEAHMLAILSVAERLDQEAQVNTRQDTALTDLESRIADLEAWQRQMRNLVSRTNLRAQ